MHWFVHEGRPRLWRFAALLLAGYVAFLTLPIALHAENSPLRRAFAALALVFFAYVIFRSAANWETLAPRLFRRK